MNFADAFKTYKYVHIPKFLDISNCRELATILQREAQKTGIYDEQCSKSKAIRDNVTFDKLLNDVRPFIEEEIGLKLIPTYAYARFYEPGEILKIHKDRPACEISATLTLDFDGDPWPIFMGEYSPKATENYRIDQDGNVIFLDRHSEIAMDVGDIVIYRGCEVLHWRDKYTQGKWQAQVFLHYVDANGPYTEWAYDKRKGLNLPNNTEKKSGGSANFKDDDLTGMIYENAITEAECDELIGKFKNERNNPALIYSADNKMIVDTSVRNVNTYGLPPHQGIGAKLTGIGLDANYRKWNFILDRSNQVDLLRYPPGGGRYKAHIDTLFVKSDPTFNECRKLTVLAFLNDDYVGGKFFLQMGKEKFYPPQKKGSVLVFPSFMVHGVEDVIEGERYTVVTWMVGPWFK